MHFPLHLPPLPCPPLSLSTISKILTLDFEISPASFNKLGKEDVSESIQYIVAQLI